MAKADPETSGERGPHMDLEDIQVPESPEGGVHPLIRRDYGDPREIRIHIWI